MRPLSHHRHGQRHSPSQPLSVKSPVWPPRASQHDRRQPAPATQGRAGAELAPHFFEGALPRGAPWSRPSGGLEAEHPPPGPVSGACLRAATARHTGGTPLPLLAESCLRGQATAAGPAHPAGQGARPPAPPRTALPRGVWYHGYFSHPRPLGGLARAPRHLRPGARRPSLSITG